VAMDLCPVSDAPEKAIGDPWRATRTSSDFADPLLVYRHPQQAGRSAEDRLQVGRVVEIQVSREAEAITKRTWQQPRAGRGRDEGERLDGQGHRCRTRSLADHDIDTEVLHRDIEHLLRRARRSMHLVDEQHLSWMQAREDGREVAGVLKGRSTGDS